jgi:hypothetical protein
MPILDNNQVILSFGGGGGTPLNVTINPNSLTGNQNSTVFSFTESGPDLAQVSKRVYVFDDESTSQTANPSYTFTKSGNKKVSAYFYSNDLTKVGYSEANLTVYQPSGYTCDLISNCDICGALTKEASAYTGPLVRLLRESDWQTADIPYNSFETLDTVSATTFLNLSIDDNLTGLPLDIMSPTKSLGYSTFRKLRTSYTGDCMTIRRSSDNAILNVGFGNDGYIATSAITNFLTGSTTGYCTTLHNQGTLGSAGDFIQSSQINQPVVDYTSFPYPVLDVSYRPVGTATTYTNLVVRTQSTVTSNYTNVGKLNLFYKIKAKPTQPVTLIIPFTPNASSNYYYYNYAVGSLGTNTFNSYGVGNAVVHPTINWVNWTLWSNRVRMDSDINNLRYGALSMNNFDVQKSISGSQTFKTTTNTQTFGGVWINYASTSYSFQGWVSELLIDDTDLTHNQFYKIKKNVSTTFENIPYSSETKTGLRVMRIYNQKSPTEDYIQNCVSNMPEFRITDPTFNRPAIFARNTYLNGGDTLGVEPRYSSMILNNSASTPYNSQYTFINLYVPFSGRTSFNNKSGVNDSSGNNLYQTFGNPNIVTTYYNVGNNAVIIQSTYSNLSPLKIECYRQIINTGATPNGLRTLTIGTGSTSSSTSITNGCVTTERSLLFHTNGAGTAPAAAAYVGHMFFDMSFSSIPTDSDWNNLIYPLLRNKYGASN